MLICIYRLQVPICRAIGPNVQTVSYNLIVVISQAACRVRVQHNARPETSQKSTPFGRLSKKECLIKG
jgi:hypothetical protein